MPAMVEIREFLAQHHLGVVGLDPGDAELGGLLWQRLLAAGYQLELVAPHAPAPDPTVAVHDDVTGLPLGVGGVLVLTPGTALDAVAGCADRRIPRVWIHRRLVGTDEGQLAVAAGRRAGLVVIDGTCPLLFLDATPTARRGGRVHRPVERWLRR